MKPILITIAFIAIFAVAKAQQVDTTKFLTSEVDQMPTFPGVSNALFTYIKTNKRYPKSALKNKVEGEVVLTFVVENDGTLSGFKISRHLSPDCDAEAIRLMKNSPKWKPGIRYGRPVRVEMNLLINFNLPEQYKAASRRDQMDSLGKLPDEQKVYSTVQIEPTFPGGFGKWNQYLKDNLKYPATALQSGIHGNVFLSFIVEEDGSISNVKIVRGLSPEIDTEAVRILSNSPKWNPGIQDGKPVRVQYLVPINFSLQVK